MFFKSRLKTFLFNQLGFYWTLIWPATSASEVTTVWRYRNSIIIIITITINTCYNTTIYSTENDK